MELDNTNIASFWINHLLALDKIKSNNSCLTVGQNKFSRSTKTVVTFGRSTTSNIAITNEDRSCNSIKENLPVKYTQRSVSQIVSLDKSKTPKKDRFRHSKCEKDIAEAQDKLIRRLQYSREVASTGKNSISLHVDSITRVVVQSFRKVINCERCSLFLMDHSTNELYFKPVGELETGTRNPRTSIHEIRFPSTNGIAGWVATNKKFLNVEDAYLDSRFLKEIDQRTHFRTKSVLCMPVFSKSASDFVLGVVQMLNKIDRKKKKSNEKVNYISCDDSSEVKRGFTREDVATLHRCCDEVSKVLDEVLINEVPQGQCELDFGIDFNPSGLKDSNQNISLSQDGDTTNTDIGTARKIERKISTSKGSRRRSSIASLVQFVNSETIKPMKQTIIDNTCQGKGVSEALSQFQFRSTSGQQITAKGQMQDDADFAAAAYKRKRMTEYTKRRTNDGSQDELALSVSLWNISAKFKQLVNCDICRIFFLESKRDFFFRCDHSGSRFPITHGVIGSVLSSEERVLINDANKDVRVKESFELLNGTRPRTVCCQPIFNTEKIIIGLIELGCDRNFAFCDKQLKNLEIYAQKVSLAFSTIRDEMLIRRDNKVSEILSGTKKLSGVTSLYVQKLNDIAVEMTNEIQEEEQRIKKEMKRNSMMEMTANEAAARFQFRTTKVKKILPVPAHGQKAPESSKNWQVFKKLFKDD